MKRLIPPELLWAVMGLFAVLCQAIGIVTLVTLFIILVVGV